MIKVGEHVTLDIIGTVPNCGKEETNFAISKASESWKNWKEKSAKNVFLLS